MLLQAIRRGAAGAILAMLALALAGHGRPGGGGLRGSGAVLAGIDVLAGEGFAALAGKRVGLITNQTGRAADGRRTVDVLAAAPGVKLVALFAPEHGPPGRGGGAGGTPGRRGAG